MSAVAAERRPEAEAASPDLDVTSLEPAGPDMRTAVPGPRSRELNQRLGGIQVGAGNFFFFTYYSI